MEPFKICYIEVLGYGVFCKHKGTLLDGVLLRPPNIVSIALLDTAAEPTKCFGCLQSPSPTARQSFLTLPVLLQYLVHFSLEVVLEVPVRQVWFPTQTPTELGLCP